jgi:uncharacterized protein
MYAEESSQEHLGTGISFPVQVSSQGTIQLSPGKTSVDESIKIILRTHLGERVYRPNFGCRLSELAFAPLNTETLMQIRLYVQEALEQWEPRINLESVVTEPDPVRGKVDVVINYQIKKTYEAKSFVFPFYLSGSKE